MIFSTKSIIFLVVYFNNRRTQLELFFESYTELFGDLLPRISIFDQKTARITVGKHEIKNSKEYLTTIIESQACVNILRIHFLQMWDNGIEFEDLIK